MDVQQEPRERTAASSPASPAAVSPLAPTATAPTPERSRYVSRFTVAQWFALSAATLALVIALGAGLGGLAITRLTHARTLVLDRNGPAVLASLKLSNALIDEETGVRGYALTGEPAFLKPYDDGLADERVAFAQLAKATTFKELVEVGRDTALVRARAIAWRRVYAEPTIVRVRTQGSHSRERPSADVGRRAFDALRGALATQNAHLSQLRTSGRARLSSQATFLTDTFVAIVALAAIGILGTMLGLRVVVTAPLRRLGRGVRRTARGDFHHAIEGNGPRDVIALAADVDTMRQTIVAELASLQSAADELDAQKRELQRSNAELEQFAYVASHDLQEPLRKVASFCQLLEQRYKGQLDERGDQYIAFAVDGAKRMQQLIQDLLAFSRVGRLTAEAQPVDIGTVLQEALTSLAAAIEESGARVSAGPLPTVRGEPALLAAVFQNLVGNALKFHGETPPRIEIAAERRGAMWIFSCRDHGIGIEPEYAERIFLIFQRLHAKHVYAGTGIGLAMCRKIVEYHGGRIWLDTESEDGTTFRFALPALEEPA